MSSAALLMYRDCPFCGEKHSSMFIDELEESIMACRERVMPEQRGTLDAWGERETLPVRPEIEAYSHGIA